MEKNPDWFCKCLRRDFGKDLVCFWGSVGVVSGRPWWFLLIEKLFVFVYCDVWKGLMLIEVGFGQLPFDTSATGQPTGHSALTRYNDRNKSGGADSARPSFKLETSYAGSDTSTHTVSQENCWGRAGLKFYNCKIERKWRDRSRKSWRSCLFEPWLRLF